MFLDKYGDGVFLEGTPEVVVTLTNLQYRQLNEDLLKMNKFKEPLLLMIDEADLKEFNPEKYLYTRIVIPHLCQFIVQLGEDFEFKLSDPEQEYGDEDL